LPELNIQWERFGKRRAGKDADKKPCYPTEADGRAGDTLLNKGKMSASNTQFKLLYDC